MRFPCVGRREEKVTGERFLKTGFLKKVRAPRKAPSICYYPMKTLFEYKDKCMLFFFEILKAQ